MCPCHLSKPSVIFTPAIPKFAQFRAHSNTSITLPFHFFLIYLHERPFALSLLFLYFFSLLPFFQRSLSIYFTHPLRRSLFFSCLHLTLQSKPCLLLPSSPNPYPSPIWPPPLHRLFISISLPQGSVGYRHLTQTTQDLDFTVV